VARLEAGLTQAGLAMKLGQSQGYVSLLENGRRTPSPTLARRLVKVLGMPPTALPFEVDERASRRDRPEWIVKCLASLGYPGFAYLDRTRHSTNPAEVLLRALRAPRLEPRLVESLPWLLLGFTGFDRSPLVRTARALNLQNRLGFVVALARAVARRNPDYAHRLPELDRLAADLEPYRLACVDDLGQGFRSARLREWVRRNRSEAAVHWNLLTDLTPEHLPHVS
jgi:transcriptional regulator with XRE-family HTH domain